MNTRSITRSTIMSAAAFLLAVGYAVLASAQPVADKPLELLTSTYLKAVKPGEEAEAHRELFAPVLQRIQRSYTREVEMQQLVAAAVKALEPLNPGVGQPAEIFGKAINAALATLDPYSSYMDPVAAQLQGSSIGGRFGGLGIQVDMMDGLVRVVSSMPDTPAARAGLLNGDLIVGFDNQPVLGMTLMEAVARMRGKPGTPIALTIRRGADEKTFTVSLVRELIGSEPVSWSMERGVLVLRISSFTGTVSPALGKMIGEIRTAPRAIVLDLRGNGGGLLRQAITTADTFLSEGEIVSTRGRTDSSKRSWRADPIEQFAGVPMVVLIDDRSASAAELVAAALQENGRATVMGQRSFGKGSVQSLISLGEGKGMLRLTTAQSYGPSGRSVQRTGVGPDINLVPATTVGDRRREANRPHALPGADEPPPPKASVEESHCAPARKDLDPGLACALAFIDAGGFDGFLAVVGRSVAP